MIRTEEERDELPFIVAPAQEEVGEPVQPGVEHRVVRAAGQDASHGIQAVRRKHFHFPSRAGTVGLLDARPLGRNGIHQMPADGQEAAFLVEPFGHLADVRERDGVEAAVVPQLQFAQFAAGHGRIVPGFGLGIGIPFHLPPGVAGEQVVLVSIHDAFLPDLGEPFKKLPRFRGRFRVRALEGLRGKGQRSAQGENCQ